MPSTVPTEETEQTDAGETLQEHFQGAPPPPQPNTDQRRRSTRRNAGQKKRDSVEGYSMNTNKKGKEHSSKDAAPPNEVQPASAPASAPTDHELGRLADQAKRDFGMSNKLLSKPAQFKLVEQHKNMMQNAVGETIFCLLLLGPASTNKVQHTLHYRNRRRTAFPAVH